jgi:hypothetical protein
LRETQSYLIFPSSRHFKYLSLELYVNFLAPASAFILG